MKAIVVYHSFMGSTRKVARAIASGLGAPYIKTTHFRKEEAGDYDLIVFGCPVRIFGVPEDMKKVLRSTKFRNVAFFTTTSVDGAQVVLRKMKRLADYSLCLGEFSCLGEFLLFPFTWGRPTAEALERAREFGEKLKMDLEILLREGREGLVRKYDRRCGLMAEQSVNDDPSAGDITRETTECSERKSATCGTGSGESKITESVVSADRTGCSENGKVEGEK